VSTFVPVALAGVCSRPGFLRASSPEHLRGTGDQGSAGALQSPHVDDPDTRRMWTMLQSLLSEAGQATNWRRR